MSTIFNLDLSFFFSWHFQLICIATLSRTSVAQTGRLLISPVPAFFPPKKSKGLVRNIAMKNDMSKMKCYQSDSCDIQKYNERNISLNINYNYLLNMWKFYDIWWPEFAHLSPIVSFLLHYSSQSSLHGFFLSKYHTNMDEFSKWKKQKKNKECRYVPLHPL